GQDGRAGREARWQYRQAGDRYAEWRVVQAFRPADVAQAFRPAQCCTGLQACYRNRLRMNIFNSRQLADRIRLKPDPRAIAAADRIRREAAPRAIAAADRIRLTPDPPAVTAVLLWVILFGMAAGDPLTRPQAARAGDKEALRALLKQGAKVSTTE